MLKGPNYICFTPYGQRKPGAVISVTDSCHIMRMTLATGTQEVTSERVAVLATEVGLRKVRFGAPPSPAEQTIPSSTAMRFWGNSPEIFAGFVASCPFLPFARNSVSGVCTGCAARLSPPLLPKVEEFPQSMGSLVLRSPKKSMALTIGYMLSSVAPPPALSLSARHHRVWGVSAVTWTLRAICRLASRHRCNDVCSNWSTCEEADGGYGEKKRRQRQASHTPRTPPTVFV